MMGGSDRLEGHTGEPTSSAHASRSESPSEDQFESFLAALASSPPPYRPPLLAPGDVFAERYRIERELGRGGMGTVHLATDLELGRKVALKVALGRRAESELERLLREATIMAGLSHPGIVTIYEAATTGEHLYITLEFVPGGTLRDWIDLGRHAWRDVVTLFVEIADALSEAHCAGVVHRDFKPANVLLDLEGRPRIADFGLARSVGALDTQQMRMLPSNTTTRTGAVMGTPAYMAPEQARGTAATPAADQFSFFVSLFEASCGKRPFSGDTLFQLLDDIESGPPDECRGAPRSLMEVMRRGLAFDPANRYPDMQSVAQALRRVLGARRRRLQLGGAVFGVAAALALGYGVAPRQRPPCEPTDVAASIDAVWTSTVSDAIASESGEATSTALDAYRGELVAERVEACEAHAVHRDLSDTDFALRAACLDRAEARFAGLVDDILGSPRELANTDLVLPPPRGCTDTVALRRYANALASTSVVDDARRDRANMESIRLLTRARQQALRGDDFQPLAREVVELADTHGLAASKAEALVLLASRPGASEAEQTALLGQAVEAAGDDAAPEFLADVAVFEGALALDAGEPELAGVHLSHAESMARLGTAPVESDQLERDLLRVRIALATKDDTTETVKDLDGILAQLPGPDGHRYVARRLRADALLDRGRLGEAERAYAEILADTESVDGFGRLALHVNRAISLRRSGRAEEAASAIEAGRAAYDAPLTDELEANILIGEGAVALLRRDHAAAAERLQRAADILTAVDSEHALLGDTWHHQARLALQEGEARRAFERSNAALALWDRHHGPGSLDAARTLLVMSEALHALGHDDQAAEAANVAVGILRDRHRPDDEVALAELAVARAEGSENRDAQRVCASSELEACREALAMAGTAPSP